MVLHGKSKNKVQWGQFFLRTLRLTISHLRQAPHMPFHGHGRWMATTAETDFCHIVLRHILMSDHYTRLYPQDLHCHDVLKNLFLNTIKYKYVRVHILIRNNYCNFFHNCSLVPLVTFQLYICIMPGLHMKLLSHYSCALFIRLMISPQIPM